MSTVLSHHPTRPVVATVGAVLCALTAACGASPRGGAALAVRMAVAATFPPPDVTVTPSNGSQGVRLDAPVVVTARSGSLQSVTVRGQGDASPLRGSLSTNRRRWTSSGGMGAETRYVVEVVAVGPHGDMTTGTSAFTTMAADRLTADMRPGDGDVVGVGMPIILTFNSPIPTARQAELLDHVTVTSVPPVAGAWHWFTRREVHWRPADLWPAGTRVEVTANLRGVEGGDGIWGLDNWSSAFAVGPRHVSTIDVASHEMQVFDGDQLIHTWPVSAGRPSLPTLGGTLYVPYKSPDVLMDSATLGIPRTSPDGYYEHVLWDTAISVDGFYVHAAPWSEAQQGSVNVSHGCVNLSPDRAQTFYTWSQVGDVVIVRNTPRLADYGDGEGDWQIPFAQFANSGGVAPVPDRAYDPSGV